MKSYLDLLRTSGVGRIIAAQLTARFPSGMLSLAYLLHIEHLFHSYGAAGLVLATTSIGQAVSGPLTSRWMGRWAMRPVLILTTLVCSTTMIVVALLPPGVPLPVYMAVGLLGGLAFPPVQPAVRTIYPKMVTARQLTPLFSLDASAQEIIWVAGPVVTTFIATQISTVLAILIAAGFCLGGGAWFIFSPEVGRVRIPRSKRAFGKVLTRPTVLVVTVVGFVLIGACAAIEASVVASFGEGSVESGAVLAVFALGSLVGGLAFGHAPVGRWSLARRMIVFVVGAVASVIAWEFWSLTAAVLIAGLAVAPALAVMFAAVSSSVKFSDTAEAYGWVGTGQLIGAAAGSAIAGVMIDHFDARGGLAAAAGFAVFALLVPLIFARALPDLRGRDASPIPDTEPVQTLRP